MTSLLVEQAPFYKPLIDFLAKHEAWDLMADLKSAQQAAAPGALEADDRAKWTTKQWYEHVGAWETPEGHISFGSVMALGAMLIQFQRAHRLAAPSAPGTPKPNK